MFDSELNCELGTDSRCRFCGGFMLTPAGNYRCSKREPAPVISVTYGIPEMQLQYVTPDPTLPNGEKFDKEMYLGDYTEAMLDYVVHQFGFEQPAKEVYTAMKAAIGLAPFCWCPERQEWMNRADKYVRDNAKSFMKRLIGK